jgi:hypothetical protein
MRIRGFHGALTVGAASAAGFLLGIAPSTAAAPTPACAASALTGSFSVVRGSAGAGNIGYTLRLTNHGHSTCVVSGRPGLKLLDSHGHGLPTHVVALSPGRGTAVKVSLKPGKAAIARARFTPDVPGRGEKTKGPCEPKATHVRVTLASPGHGSLVVPVRPPTPVCQRGSIQLDTLRAA